MLDNLLDPVVLAFIAGLAAGILRSDLRIPEALYETLSIFLLLSIGLKGGVELAQSPLVALLLPILGTLVLGLTIPLIAYAILRRLGGFDQANAAAIAAHYGSVSAVTFAVCLAFLIQRQVVYDEYVTVLLVVLEVPAIGIGVLLARLSTRQSQMKWGTLVHEILLGKSIFLLLAGLVIGYLAGPERIVSIAPLFFDLFKGALALFLLEMGLVTSRRLPELRRVGSFLVGFGIAMPLFSAVLGIAVGLLAGMSVGGTTVLATLAASASYIAAPAAMRIAVPQANPTYYLTASLGITFPFNIVIGIPLYFWATQMLYQLW
jgi:uncharacterized protein